MYLHIFMIFNPFCSINVTYSLEQRLRRKINADEEAKLNREIRSVAPTSPNNDVITTRATYGTVNVIFNEDGLEREIGPDGIKPTEHEIVYYKTCLACREQQELCQVRKKKLTIWPNQRAKGIILRVLEFYVKTWPFQSPFHFSCGV